MNPLTWLNPARWLAALALAAILAAGGYLGYRHLVARAVAAQKAVDEAILNQTIGAANGAAEAQRQTAQAETARRDADAQRRIHDLETERAAVAGRADAFARQLRELRAQGAGGLRLPGVAATQPGARPDGLSVVPAPAGHPAAPEPQGDPLDDELTARLAQAEQLRLSCVKLWEQAQADRRVRP